MYNMRDNDLEAILMMTKKHFSNSSLKNFVGISPDSREVEVFKTLVPGANITTKYRKDWDLNNPADFTTDVMWATNVFMYSNDPDRWFMNVLNSCKYFLLTDNTRAWRGGSVGELGDDGDSMRYYMDLYTKPDLKNAYCLNQLSPIDFQKYTMPSKCGVKGFEEAVTFSCLIRGRI